jgi:hypothetical protein
VYGVEPLTPISPAAEPLTEVARSQQRYRTPLKLLLVGSELLK